MPDTSEHATALQNHLGSAQTHQTNLQQALQTLYTVAQSAGQLVTQINELYTQMSGVNDGLFQFVQQAGESVQGIQSSAQGAAAT